MVLGFDIGNTSTSMAIYPVAGVVPDALFRFDTGKRSSARMLGAVVRNLLISGTGNAWKTVTGSVQGIALSSVVPELNKAFHDIARKLFNKQAFEVNEKSRLSLRLMYDNPAQIGPDRLVNAEAAYAEYGESCIVADLGTAVTFTVIHKGAFEGGIIAPGIGTAIESLASKASRLPKISFEKPDRLVARDTENAIKSGFFYGWISLVEGMASKIEQEYGAPFRLILTGGYSSAIQGHIARECVHDPLLTMKGIKRVYDLNR